MSNIFVVDNTAGTSSLTLEPGSFNGPGGIYHSTDLRLHGMGVLMWGEGVNENFVRLLENFACPAKETGDTNPNDSDNPNYDPSTMPVYPKNATDLAKPGHGISVPIDGQTWFNTDDRQIYVYDSQLEQSEFPGITGGWKLSAKSPVSDTPPENPNVGDYWYNTGTGGSPNDSGWNRVGLSTSGSNQFELMIYNPSHPEADANGYVSVAADYVSQYGDWMTGELSMGGNDGTEKNKIVNLGDPTDDYDAVNKRYLDDEITTLTSTVSGDLAAHDNDARHITSAQNVFLDTIESNCSVAMNGNLGNDLCQLSGYDAGSSNTVIADMNNRIKRDGDDMDVAAYLGLGTSGTPTIPAQDHHVVPKVHLDNKIEDITGGTSTDRVSRTFTSITLPNSLARDGDIAVASGKAYVMIGGVWKQIFPAVYA